MDNKDNAGQTRPAETKFNMGLATLESIRKLLDFYTKLSIMDSVEFGNKNFKITDTLEAQILKSRTCNQLLMTARVVLKSDQITTLETQLLGTAILVKNIRNEKGIIIRSSKVFSYTVDAACDKFVSALVDALQKNGVFMPSKGESALF